ncbi:MAG: hypothetical protein KDC34_19055 [Saprospiraceae bacterium]|nr:hypothetical protein [Saprospiraceae bacterium]
MANGYINNFQDLEKWFRQANSNRWSITRGQRSSKQYIMLQDSEEMDLDDSWELMREILEMNAHGGGMFNIFVRTGARNTGFNTNFSLRDNQQVAGVGGVGGRVGGVGLSPNSYIDQQIDQRMRIYDLERSLEDARAELNAEQSPIERLINGIIEHENFDPNTLIQTIGPAIGALFGKRRVPVSMAGFPGEGAAKQPEETTDDDQEARLGSALQRLQTHFPDLVSFMEDLANYADKNPAMVQTLYANMK